MRCFLDSAFGLEFVSPEGETTLRIEGPFLIVANGISSIASVEHPETVGRAFSLLWTVAESATVADDGTLQVRFEGNHQLTVRPDPAYEAWEIIGPDGYHIVCKPGGDLAIWEGKR